MSRFRIPCAVGLGGALALAIFARGPAAIEARAQFQTTPTTFSGRATVLSGSVLGIPIPPIVAVDTGEVAPSGGTLEAHLICYPDGPNCAAGVPDLTKGALGVEVLNATVVAQGHRSSAEASVAELTLNVLEQQISATLLQARAVAECAGDQASVKADSEIAGLTINGQTIEVSGKANQTIDLPVPGGFVVINEQVASVNGNDGEVTVSALHIVIPALTPGGPTTDLVVARAHADIQCGVRFCPADKDFVTGGGTFANPKSNFAVAGGIKNGGFWGHLLFIDHVNGLKVKGTGVTAYEGAETGATSRHIEGTCEINGTPGTYSADVDDQGEPGVHDTLTLSLNGGAPVAAGVLSGGNIQLHTCK